MSSMRPSYRVPAASVLLTYLLAPALALGVLGLSGLGPTRASAQDAEAEQGPAAEASSEEAAPRARRTRQARASESSTTAPNALLLEGTMRVDVQQLDILEVRGGVVVNGSDAGRQLGGMLYFGLMMGISDTLRVGAGFGWGGTLKVSPDDEDTITLGQLLLLDVRVDVMVPVKDDLSIILAPRLGAQLIAPGGELNAVIDTRRGEGYSTIRGPRAGLVVGADAGVRWEAANWLALRGTFGYAYTWSPLLRSSASSNQFSGESDWTLSAHRLRVALGVEVMF